MSRAKNRYEANHNTGYFFVRECEIFLTSQND